ncbi:MAG: trehalose-phosphatase [Pseudomonadota bacterium]
MTTPPPLTPDNALFLDFDGTLVEIAPRPDGIVLDPMLRGALARLHQRLGGAVAIVSGRPIAEIDHWLQPLQLPCAGVHGAERRSEAGVVTTVHATTAVAAVAERLQALAARHAGLLVERKSVSVALHYRLAPQLEPVCRAMLQEAVSQEPSLRLLQGKQVLEVLPRGVGKGHAIDTFLAEPPFKGRCPVFVGDDVTDEAGFQRVQQRGGIAVKVGPGETAAQCRIDNPVAVRQWLCAPLADSSPSAHAHRT